MKCLLLSLFFLLGLGIFTSCSREKLDTPSSNIVVDPEDSEDKPLDSTEDTTDTNTTEENESSGEVTINEDKPTGEEESKKEYYNRELLLQLSAVSKDEEMKYLISTEAAPNSLNCINGTTSTAEEKISIPAGSADGETRYFYAISCDLSGVSSLETVRTFVFDNTPPDLPIASETGENFDKEFNLILTIASSKPVAPEYIRYTSNGDSLPSCNSGTLYTGPINIKTTSTIKAIACDAAGNRSPAEFSHTYTLK